MKNKKAWIKIMEAFISILFIILVISSIFYKQNLKEQDLSSQIKEKEFEILHLIETNESLRQEILNVSEVQTEINDENFPNVTKNYFNNQTPNALECSLKICSPGEICELNSIPEKKDIYIQSILITSTKEVYNPLKLNSFCWRR